MSKSLENSYLDLVTLVCNISTGGKSDKQFEIKCLENECLSGLAQFTTDIKEESTLIFLNKTQRLKYNDYISKIDSLFERIEAIPLKNGQKSLTEFLKTFLDDINDFNTMMAKSQTKANDWYNEALSQTKQIELDKKGFNRLKTTSLDTTAVNPFDEIKKEFNEISKQLKAYLASFNIACKNKEQIDQLLVTYKDRLEKERKALKASEAASTMDEKIPLPARVENEDSLSDSQQISDLNLEEQEYRKLRTKQHSLDALKCMGALIICCILYAFYLQWTGWCAFRFFVFSMIFPAVALLWFWKELAYDELNKVSLNGFILLFCLDILQQFVSLIRGTLVFFGKNDFGILDKLVPITVGEFFAIMPHYLFAFGVFHGIIYFAIEIRESRNSK